MRKIVSANYCQQKQWELAWAEREVEEGRRRMTPEERAEAEKNMQESCDRFLEEADEVLAARRKIPSPLRRWRFQWETRRALALAQFYELNVSVECDENIGIISFSADEILSDVTWRGGRSNLRMLLGLMARAENFELNIRDEYGLHLVQIRLLYPLNRIITKGWTRRGFKLC